MANRKKLLGMLAVVLGISVFLAGCSSYKGRLLSYYTPDRFKLNLPDLSLAYIKMVSVGEIDTMGKWGARAKDLQGQVFQLTASDIGRAYILERAALIAWDSGCKAFTILDEDEISRTYDAYIGSEWVTPATTTIQDSKGNVIATTSSTPEYKARYRQETTYRRYTTIQILKDDDDTRFDNIYLVSKYLPKFVRIVGLENKSGAVGLTFFEAVDGSDIIYKYRGFIEGSVAYFGKISESIKPGQYGIILYTDYDEAAYLYTNGKTAEQLGITDGLDGLESELSKAPEYVVSDQPIELMFNWFVEL
jgi:hypothetical protein